MTEPTPEYEKDRAEIASEEGFTGTFHAFLDWLKGALIYGGIRVHDPKPDEWGRLATRVETVTGGFSSDEMLLGRLRRSMWLSTNWVLSERGGLDVYEFPYWLTDSDEERVWLEPDRGLLQTVYRARRLRVYDRHGDYVEFAYDGPAELVFQEPDRDINAPDGLLMIRPAKDRDSLTS